MSKPQLSKSDKKLRAQQEQFNLMRDRVLSVLSETEYYWFANQLLDDESPIDAFKGMK
jgi:hypothetical protein